MRVHLWISLVMCISVIVALVVAAAIIIIKLVAVQMDC